MNSEQEEKRKHIIQQLRQAEEEFRLAQHAELPHREDVCCIEGDIVTRCFYCGMWLCEDHRRGSRFQGHSIDLCISCEKGT